MISLKDLFLIFNITGAPSHPLPGSAPQTFVSGSAPAAAAPALPAMDINSLFSKLLEHGIINKKSEEDKFEKIPDLTSLLDKVLKV